MELALEKIKLKKTDEKPCQLTFAVNVPQDLVSAKEEQVARDFQKVAQLPGFRAGKAPLDLVRRNFSDRVKNQALEELLKDVVMHVLQEKQLAPVSTPMVDQLKFEGNLSFNLIVEKSPEFSVKGYAKIPVTRKLKPVTDADVQKELDELRERNAQLAQSQAERAEKEHYAAIDYAGSADGRELPELKAENQLIHLAAPQTIQGFAEGIPGMARGESKEVPVDFPKEYGNKALAGKKVVFKITLKDIKEKRVPALDDEFAKDLGLASLDELKTKIRESLTSWSERSARHEVEKQIYDHLAEENPIPLPESLVAQQLESLVEQTVANEMRDNGDSVDNLEERKKALRGKLRSNAERHVRLSYLISRIAQEEKLRATDEEYRQELEKAEKSNPQRVEEVRKYFEHNHERIMSQITEEKVLKYLTDHAKIKEVKE